jgi:argininosuccinate synthase
VPDIKKIVLAYSGGLDTSVAIRWLADRYHAEIVAYCADVGQEEDLELARKKALGTGAEQVIVEDRREAFVEGFVFPALRAAAVYEGEYLLGTSLARPCIIQGLMEAARELGADAIAHGATGKGNDQVRFELGAYHFMPEVKIIAPWREWEFRSRSQLLAYVKEHGIPVEASLEKPYSVDRNLFHVSYEGGILEDPWREPDGAMFQRTQDPEKAPAEARYLEIDFEAGDPIAVDGRRLPPAELLMLLNTLAGEHGIGRVDLVEDRFVGMKSRGVYETPGGTVLHRARRAVESLTLDREVMRLRDDLVPRYAGLVYNGFWFSPEREALQGLIDDIARPVTGTARVKLYKGAVTVAGRRAARSLYRADIATFEEENVYDQRDAAGFIKLNALRLRTRAALEAAAKRS